MFAYLKTTFKDEHFDTSIKNLWLVVFILNFFQSKIFKKLGFRSAKYQIQSFWPLQLVCRAIFYKKTKKFENGRGNLLGAGPHIFWLRIAHWAYIPSLVHIGWQSVNAHCMVIVFRYTTRRRHVRENELKDAQDNGVWAHKRRWNQTGTLAMCWGLKPASRLGRRSG